MQRFSSKQFRNGVGLAAVVVVLMSQTLSAEETTDSSAPSNAPKNPTRMNFGAQIECVTPDGQSGQVSRLSAPDPGATALIMEDDTVTCLLQEGETNFVIELPRRAPLDRFTFLNENAAARGELRISVSNHRLPANSPEWTAVEGIVPFAHKRLFGVSLLGIEAKFVRLSFRVEQKGSVSAVAPTSGDLANETPARVLSDIFRASALQDALNSSFGSIHSRPGRIFLSSVSPSVGPLSPH
jgi:hypothetical protein